jgi:phosphoserine aminotransferase
VAPWYTTVPPDHQAAAAKRLAALLEKEGAANDIAAYRDAPPGLRIWGGGTVDTVDIAALLPWLDWAHDVVAAEYATAKAAE